MFGRTSILISCGLFNGVLGRIAGSISQSPLVPTDYGRILPGGSIVQLCPESRPSDLLVIERIVNEPDTPWL